MQKPLKRRGMSDDVADRIRESILDGSLSPGERINEVELAKVLSVSRGPVRDAITILRQEGLLQGEWHRGSFVTEFEEHDLEEIYSVRFAIELVAIRALIANRTDDDLLLIESHAKAVDDAVQRGNQREMLSADIAFHDAIYERSGNRRLELVWLSLRSQIALLLGTRQRNHDDYRTRISSEHWELFTAIRDRNGEAAEGLVRDHIRTAFERLRTDLGADEEPASLVEIHFDSPSTAPFL